MKKIPENILNYIKKIYPDNRFVETVDYLPEGMTYPYKEIIDTVTNEIQEKYDVDLFILWYMRFESKIPVFIYFPKTGYNYDDIIDNFQNKKIDLKENTLYALVLGFSIISPFAAIGWNKKYYDNDGTPQTDYFKSPPSRECEKLEKIVKPILSSNNITIISQELLRESIPGFTGKNKGGKPPTIYNYLFENTH